MLVTAANITDVNNPASAFSNASGKIDIANLNIGYLLSGGSGNLNLINLTFFIVGLIFFANLVLAAVGFIGSEGQPDRISSANSRITMGVVGLVIVFASFVIVKLVASLFGFDASVPIT